MAELDKDYVCEARSDIKDWVQIRVTVKLEYLDRLTAIMSMALCYMYGDGVEVDMKEGFKLCRKAAKENYVDAMFTLGECYRYGYGTMPDSDKAIKWYQKAAEQGHKQAAKALKEFI